MGVALKRPAVTKITNSGYYEAIIYANTFVGVRSVGRRYKQKGKHGCTGAGLRQLLDAQPALIV